MPSAPRTPAEHHKIEARGILHTLGSLTQSLEAPEVDREVQVAIVHAILAVAEALTPERAA